MRIHHIGYLVKKMDRACAVFEELGYVQEGAQVTDGGRGVYIRFLQLDGYRIEVVCPYRQDSVAAGLLKSRKNSPYHICYETADFEQEIRRLEESGYHRIGEPEEAPAMGHRRVVFLVHPDMGMLELLEAGTEAGENGRTAGAGNGKQGEE